MDNNVLPAVRVPTMPAGEGDEGEGIVETPIVDLPPSEKFGFAWPDKSMVIGSPPSASHSTILSRNEPESTSEIESSEAESMVSRESTAVGPEREASGHTPTNGTPTSPNATPVPPSPPRLSRAFSMPIPSQLGHLKNPHRSFQDSPFPLPSPLALSQSPNISRFHELSIELADSVQMVIQTLLQISPPHLLDPAKEQFSACSLSVPSPSISAMLTAMKNLNYMSANIATFTDDKPLQVEGWENFVDSPPEPRLDDFDIGELLQSVGDALSGVAAQAGIDLVLFHADVGMKHVSVRGDECGISYGLSHVIRQVLEIAQRGDTIEIGLHITAESSKQRESTDISDGDSISLSRASSIVPDVDGPLHCMFEVAHKFATPDTNVTIEENSSASSSTSLFRERPRLDTIFLRRLLKYTNGSITEDLQPRLFAPGRACEVLFILEPGSPELLTRPIVLSAEEEAMRQPYANANIQLATEPSLEELAQFVETLKGKKVALHASAKGSFAHHLTSYLTAWGLDVSHMTSLASEEGLASVDELQEILGPGDKGSTPTSTLAESPASMLSSESNPLEESLRDKVLDASPSFILIDDDVEALRKRLVELRSEASFNLSLRQRPKLAAHHRPKSSPNVLRAKGVRPSFTSIPSSPAPVIIHFTSLGNYKVVKDLIHSILSSPDSASLIPEVIVLPKPAGPRRVLTALRTAVVKPIVDPFFTPIATSPLSPNGQGLNPFSPFFPSPSQKSSRPAISPRTASDRSTRTAKEVADLMPRLPPSPLRESDTMEYFADAAAKLGTSPSSGLVIQSPDGQPAGIFFQPKNAIGRLQRSNTGASTSSSMVDPPNLVRDTGNLRPTGESRRSSNPRRVPKLEGELVRPGMPRNWSELSSGAGGPPEVSTSAVPTTSRRKSTIAQRTDTQSGPRVIHTEPTPSPSLMSSPSAVPTGGEAQVSSIQSPRMGGQTELRKSSSPPGSPVTGRGTTAATPAQPRRTFLRKATPDSPVVGAPPGTKKGKQSTEGGIIVPPVNVLIVEDNPINQTILSTFMKKKKIKYDVAKNGAEAVAKWKSGGFHLILMDIQMPVMDGIEATKEIRKLERLSAQQGQFPSTPPSDGQQTPSDAPSTETKSTSGSAQTPYRSSVIIVALTASSLQTDRVAALAAGCNDFLTKPVSLLWLNSKIIEWGSIKALQMWADLRPDVVKTITSGQMSQARSVANNLHVPKERKAANRSGFKPSQEEAVRMLISAGRDVDHTESDQSDAEARQSAGVAIEQKQLTPLLTSTTDSSGGSSVPAKTPPDFKVSLRPHPSRPSASREVSGEEALRAHLAEFSGDVQGVIQDRPVILGEHAMASGGRTIAEVMHSDSEHPSGSDTSLRKDNSAAKAEPSGKCSTSPVATANDRNGSTHNAIQGSPRSE